LKLWVNHTVCVSRVIDQDALALKRSAWLAMHTLKMIINLYEFAICY
jgi:hypothetical protein